MNINTASVRFHFKSDLMSRCGVAGCLLTFVTCTNCGMRILILCPPQLRSVAPSLRYWARLPFLKSTFINSDEFLDESKHCEKVFHFGHWRHAIQQNGYEWWRGELHEILLQTRLSALKECCGFHFISLGHFDWFMGKILW